MNKQELIYKIEGLPSLTSITSIRPYVDKKIVLGLISQLDEPEKVTIPQFVADWIEYLKKNSGTLYGSTVPYSYYGRAIADNFEGDVTEALGWIRNNSEAYARAWLDGYEVEKERRYIITLKSSGQKLYYHTEDEDYIFSSYDGVFYSEYHTKADLEENDMSWVFDCPGMEIQEVE